MGILWTIVIGILAGWITGKIMRGEGYGFWADMLLGIAGALLGGYIAGLLHFGGGGLIYTLVVAVIGAIIIVFLFRLITGRR
jgi:uncharacterized membrane protein YeaQ/YmgE (transglycosylase-associated protein family)